MQISKKKTALGLSSPPYLLQKNLFGFRRFRKNGPKSKWGGHVAIIDHKSYLVIFLLAPINVKSVEAKFYRCGIRI